MVFYHLMRKEYEISLPFVNESLVLFAIAVNRHSILISPCLLSLIDVQNLDQAAFDLRKSSLDAQLTTMVKT